MFCVILTVNKTETEVYTKFITSQKSSNFVSTHTGKLFFSQGKYLEKGFLKEILNFCKNLLKIGDL